MNDAGSLPQGGELVLQRLLLEVETMSPMLNS